MPTIVGTWSGDADKSVMNISLAGPRMNGTYEIVQVGKRPPRYVGKFSPVGKKKDVRVTVVLLKD